MLIRLGKHIQEWPGYSFTVAQVCEILLAEQNLEYFYMYVVVFVKFMEIYAELSSFMK